MSSIKILTIGKIKNSNLSDEINNLTKRISRLKIIELKEVKEKNIELLKKKEFELIKPHLKSSEFKILLWELGKEFKTKDFYEKIKSIDQDITFIITGAYGPSEDLKKESNMNLSLSQMTFTHEQALYMLIEQLYRCECYKNNINYTK